jgi:hypothetical protein
MNLSARKRFILTATCGYPLFFSGYAPENIEQRELSDLRMEVLFKPVSPKELLRAIRRVVGGVDLAGMDVVEVSPPYDQSEITAILAYRVVMEALSALAAGRG